MLLNLSNRPSLVIRFVEEVGPHFPITCSPTAGLVAKSGRRTVLRQMRWSLNCKFCKGFPPRGCARRRVSERNRRRRLLARRLKLSAKRTEEGQTSRSNPFAGNSGTRAPHPALWVTFPRGEGFRLLHILHTLPASVLYVQTQRPAGDTCGPLCIEGWESI